MVSGGLQGKADAGEESCLSCGLGQWDRDL